MNELNFFKHDRCSKLISAIHFLTTKIAGLPLFAALALAFIPVTVLAQVPATLASLGGTAPTPGPNDISQLSTAGQANKPDGLNYYTDNQTSFGTGEPGQTFTTDASGSGYLFNSLAIKTGGGTTSGTRTAQNYLLHIYTVTNGVATVMATFSATNFSFADGDWLQWSGFSLPLATNAIYAFSFGKASNTVGGWEAMGNASNNLYSGGELGLLPVAGGAITFSGSHNFDAVFDVGLVSIGTNAAAITNSAATEILSSTATLNGRIVSIGASIPQVKFFYGTNDGGTNAVAWSNNVAIGPQSGNFSATVTGLKINTAYFFTAQASNSAGISWAAPSKSFTTLTPFPPTVTNVPATAVATALATLNGQVLNVGNEYPFAKFYYGTTDGGTNPANWANQVSLGAQSGAFGAQVAGLTAGTTYYFTTFVSNSAGFAWGGPSQLFTTPTVTRVPVLTYHYDNTRQGANTNETVLTPSNVNVANFGKLFSYTVDGYVYAQPLIMTNLNIPGKGVRNVLFVATMHDSVYAFDADSNGDTNGGLLWKTNVGISSPSPITEFGARYHPGVGNLDVVPEEGMTGTPVIDPVSGTLYVDAFTREVVAGISTNYFHRIHALNVTNGTEQPYSPVTVAASVSGTGVSGDNYTEIYDGTNVVAFSAVQHCQRPALTLAGGILYACYGSHDDTDPYHGWVLGYNATNLALVSVFNTTPNATTNAFGPNAGEGALWMGGNGLSVDANTNLYFETGNGSFSANTNGGDYADSFVKLSTVSNQLSVADYFTPYNQASLQSYDADLGSGGPMLLPDSVGSAEHPHLLVGCGKEGKIYLVDRDNMGKFNASGDTNVQFLANAVGGTWSSPAYFNNLIYYQGNGDVMKAFLITNGVIVATPQSKSATSFGFPGATPTISANGTNNGIAWVIDPTPYLSSGPAVLHAYNATNLAIELYNSSQNLSRDNPGGAVKMVPPIITGGKVYVGAEYAVSVFGNAIFVTTPTISPSGGTFTNSVMLTLADTTAGASIYYTLDGTTPGTNSTLYTGPFLLTNSALVQAIAAASGAVNSGVASASFINSSAVGDGIGLLGQYWTNTTSTTFTNVGFNTPPTLTRTDAVVDFNWNSTAPDPKVGQTVFTTRWTGSVQPQFNETYTFYATADDGVRLWVNGQLLVDGWVNQGPTIYQGSITLNAQQLYNIRMDYFQNGGGAVATLAWSSLSTPQAIIPQTQLNPFTNPPPSVVLLNPTNNSSFTASASVTVSADADAPYNPIAAVSFYLNTNLFLGSVSNAPYTLTTTGLAAGNYVLTAVAVDGSGLSSTSAPVNFTVNSGSGAPYGLAGSGIATPFLNMPQTFGGSLPLLLSGTGAFVNTTNRTPAGGLIPYTPNTPLWSDAAVKSRYFALPNDGGLHTPDKQIGFVPTNSWTFPAGTVFVKNFDLVVNETNAGVPLRRLETRLLVRDVNGAVYGVTYKWRADNSDADLLTTSLNEDILITNATGVRTQTWYYPSPADCLMCHTPVAGYVLGFSTRQLNGNQNYPSTGITDNQLRTLNRLGLFNPAFDEAGITNFQKLSALTNLTASLEDRARSYLDANCAQCHQPGGSGITFDARFNTPLSNQHITNYPAGVPLGLDNARIVKPKDIWRSVLHRRMNTTDAGIKMPSLARSLIDTNAVQVFTDWINSLPGIPALAPPVISPDGGNFVAVASATLQPPDTNAVIYYTLDGSLPTTNSFLYTGPISLVNSATLSASAFETNYDNSVAAGALFFIQPLYFTSQNFSNGVFELGFSGVAGSNYVLQASTNLINWKPLSTNTASTNLFKLYDPDATNFPVRFYRVLLQ
ncbi:MAG TPA: chitobiase/beta-hexosaminidase C-terminal domain-containing protein [Verrucomicrobiae bacterium]|nr:chitobiase/beta-hexosaminidase C-terminal domain-containing protein [Verrucomicrobiae bacterium]